MIQTPGTNLQQTEKANSKGVSVAKSKSRPQSEINAIQDIKPSCFLNKCFQTPMKIKKSW